MVSLRLLLFLALAVCLYGQNEYGELRLQVHDASGAALAASVELDNQANSIHQSVRLSSSGRYTFKSLPLGRYRLSVSRGGFASAIEMLDIRSALPKRREVTLSIQALKATVEVTESDTLLDPNRTGTSYFIGSKQLRDRSAAMQQGRGLIDLIAMQPGWTLEANGILHPRESEYDTQFVINGIPQYDNRSPAFAPTVVPDGIESVKVMTGGIPAEFGQKMGGVVEINTRRNTSPGFHGSAVAQGGSFATAGGFLSGQYVNGPTTVSATAQGFLTDRYLDPAVIANYSNHASNTSFTGSVERDFNEANRVRLWVARRSTWFQVPNTRLQQDAGQRQDRGSRDTEGAVSYQHVFNPSLLGAVHGTVRDIGATLWSNPNSTPINASQDRGYREGYLNGSLAGQNGAHDWKVGAEARWASINERFGYQIAQYSYQPGDFPIFDPEIPASYNFNGHSPDQGQAAYAQDTLRWRNFTVSLGLRFDHYRLLVDESAWSPRVALAWTFQPLGTVLHGSYDRTFGTPPFENLLVSAAPGSRFDLGFYLPVRPSHGNYYEGGIAQAFGSHVRLDASYFLRDVSNFLDDDLLLNTGVSFPITYARTRIHGTEAKLSVPNWGHFSGYLSYTNAVGQAHLPVTGGLFLDDNAGDLLASTGRFPISQDIRNAARAWARCQILPRLWTSWTGTYTSGLPIEGEDLPDTGFLDLQYGPEVVRRANLERGRVRPSFSLNASVGVDLWKQERHAVTFQADAMNLTDRLNVTNFAGLLSGTAIAQPRSFGFRLRADF